MSGAVAARAGWGSHLTTAIVLVGLIIAWEVAVRAMGIKPVLLPAPSLIWAEFISAPTFYLSHAWYTLLITLGGFLVAVIVGVALAVVIVESRLLESTIYALIVGMNSVPKVAIAPLFVIWLGTGPEPKISIAFLAESSAYSVLINLALMSSASQGIPRSSRCTAW